MGVIAGMFYYEYVKGEKEGDKTKVGYKVFKVFEVSRLVRYVSYVLGVVMMVGIIFMITPENRLFLQKNEDQTPKRYFSTLFSSFYTSLSRPLFVFGLLIVLAGPFVGKGSGLQFLFGGKFYATWGKFTFFGYVLHLFVFWFYFNQLKQSLYLTHLMVIWIYISAMVITLLLSVPGSIFFESPMIQLESLVLFPKKERKVVISDEEEAPMLKGLQKSSLGAISGEVPMNSSSIERDSTKPFIPSQKP